MSLLQCFLCVFACGHVAHHHQGCRLASVLNNSRLEFYGYPSPVPGDDGDLILTRCRLTLETLLLTAPNTCAVLWNNPGQEILCCKFLICITQKF